MNKKIELERYKRIKKIINSNVIPEAIKDDLVYYIKTGIPRCPVCKKNMVRINKYTWEPDCKHAKNLRLSIG
jgi:hypothetical protein